MNILFLPVNTASQPAISVESLNGIKGVNAICITNAVSEFHLTNDSVVYIEYSVPKRKFFHWLKVKLNYRKKLRQYIEWADVLHYTWSPGLSNADDLKWARRSGKPILVEWLGSDIRDLKIFAEHNKYAEIFLKGKSHLLINKSSLNSFDNQKQFSKFNSIPLLCPEMSIYLNRNLFNEHVQLMQRMNTSAFSANYPSIQNKRPLILHAPSNKSVKGTEFILNAINELSGEYDFDFKLLHNITRKEVLEEISSCDIFIDQILLGSYGSAAMEAMSFGKPVLCYIMPKVFDCGLPEECPIVNTNPDNIKEKLAELITNASLRNLIGTKSREYMEKYHDADTLAPKLIDIYTKLLGRGK